MMNKTKILLFLLFFCSSIINAAEWKDWDLGAEAGLGYGSGGESGKILCPATMLTATKTLDNKFLELGMGYMFGSEIVPNYAGSSLDPSFYDVDEQDLYDDLVATADQDVKVRMSVIPMTVNFYYTIWKGLYVGGGLGLYHIFYKKEPLGDYRANLDSKKGEIVKSPTTTAMGFQQMVGYQVFPMSQKWRWYIGLKSFLTTQGGASGRLLGITLGGKVKYSW